MENKTKYYIKIQNDIINIDYFERAIRKANELVIYFDRELCYFLPWDDDIVMFLSFYVNNKERHKMLTLLDLDRMIFEIPKKRYDRGLMTEEEIKSYEECMKAAEKEFSQFSPY